MRFLVHVIALLALGAGCPADPDPSPVVILGTGTTEFEPLMPGQELEVHRGTQGGFHFFAHARMRGLDPGDPEMPGLVSNPQTTFSAFLESGEQIDYMFPPYRLGYVAAGGGEYELPSGRILQLQEENVPAVFGQRVRIAVAVEDKDGARAEHEVTVIAVDGGGGGDAGPDANADAGR